MDSGIDPNVVVALNDLIFETKILSTARGVGIAATVVRSVASLPAVLERVRPAMVIIDLNSLGPDAIGAVEIARTSGGDRRIVAFVAHVDADLASLARSAGADEVMPRSKFSDKLHELLSGLKGDDSPDRFD